MHETSLPVEVVAVDWVSVAAIIGFGAASRDRLGGQEASGGRGVETGSHEGGAGDGFAGAPFLRRAIRSGPAG